MSNGTARRATSTGRAAPTPPFGLGPHTRLGAGLAEMQILVMVAMMLYLVKLQPIPAQRPTVRVDPTLTLGRTYRVQGAGRPAVKGASH